MNTPDSHSPSLPLKALAALSTIPTNVFCNCLANLVTGGWDVVKHADAKILISVAAFAGLTGIVRHFLSREHKQKQQFARNLLAIKSDARTAAQLIEEIAKGKIEVSFTIDELMKTEITDACARALVAIQEKSLSDSDANAILEVLQTVATREQIEAFRAEFKDFADEARVLLWTQDYRGRETHDAVVQTQSAVARLEAEVRLIAETLVQQRNKTEEEIAARLRPIIENEILAKTAQPAAQEISPAQTASILTQGVLRAATVPGFIQQLSKTGDASLIADTLRQVSTYSPQDYVNVNRAAAEWCYLTGDIAAAQRSLMNILKVSPDDLDAINRLGHIYHLRGDLPAAEDCYRRVLDLAGDDPSGQAVACGNLGNVYHTRGDLDGAEEMYRKALAIDKKLGCLEGMAAAYGGLGIIYHTRGDLKKACEFWIKARDTYARAQMPHMARQMQQWIDDSTGI